MLEFKSFVEFFRACPSGYGGPNPAYTEDNEDYQRRHYALHEQRVLLLGDLDPTHHYAEYNGGYAHAQHHSQASHGGHST